MWIGLPFEGAGQLAYARKAFAEHVLAPVNNNPRDDSDRKADQMI